MLNYDKADIRYQELKTRVKEKLTVSRLKLDEVTEATREKFHEMEAVSRFTLRYTESVRLIS